MKPFVKKSLALFIVFSVLFGGCGGANALEEPKSQPAASPLPAPDFNMQTPPPEARQTMAQPAPAQAIGDDVPVTRAMVAKMLTGALLDANTIDNYDREITFADVPADAWYDRYVNAAFINKYMQGGSEGLFMPDAPITLQQAQTLVSQLNPATKIKMTLTEENKAKPISYALWTDVYNKFLTEMAAGKTLNDAYGIESRAYVVLATPAQNARLAPYHIVTDIGPSVAAGMDMAAYVDKEVKVLEKDSQVLAVLAVTNNAPTIQNAYVVKSDAASVTIFSGGAERTYQMAGVPANAAGELCDLSISDGNATKMTLLTTKKNGVVKKTTTADIELEGGVVVPVADNLKVYGTADGAVKWKGLNDIIVGRNMGYFVLKDGKAAAAVLTKKAAGDIIRVAISTTGFGSLQHDAVTLTSDGKFTITAGDSVMSFGPGETASVTADMFEQTPRIYAVPAAGGRLTISSVKRAWEGGASPAYPGTIEISRAGNQYNVVNELPLEQYLYAVVPSEMPSGYGVEASKVQAVTARSYALNQLYANRFHAFGANVDDSVSCQVYNNIPQNETSVVAVDATKGQYLTYNGAAVSANFFSTSCGMTANNGEVWADSEAKRFPADTKPYLKSAKQYEGADYGDLSDEQSAAAFFKAADLKGYDSAFPWFRWRVTMTAPEIAATINATIGGRYNVNPSLIKTLQPDGLYRSRPIETIGDLKNLEVTRRGQGGNIMEMKVTGTKATVLIMTEYNVRALIKPIQMAGGAKIATVKQDGSVSENYTIMPSAFYTIDKEIDENGSVTQVTFTGGGNGHGVGMSQNGVKGMIDAGKSFDEILKHYYAGCEISTMR